MWKIKPNNKPSPTSAENWSCINHGERKTQSPMVGFFWGGLAWEITEATERDHHYHSVDLKDNLEKAIVICRKPRYLMVSSGIFRCFMVFYYSWSIDVSNGINELHFLLCNFALTRNALSPVVHFHDRHCVWWDTILGACQPDKDWDSLMISALVADWDNWSTVPFSGFAISICIYNWCQWKMYIVCAAVYVCVWMFVWFCMHLPSCNFGEWIYSNFFCRFLVRFDIAPFVVYISLFGRYNPPRLWQMLRYSKAMTFSNIPWKSAESPWDKIGNFAPILVQFPRTDHQIPVVEHPFSHELSPKMSKKVSGDVPFSSHFQAISWFPKIELVDPRVTIGFNANDLGDFGATPWLRNPPHISNHILYILKQVQISKAISKPFEALVPGISHPSLLPVVRRLLRPLRRRRLALGVGAAYHLRGHLGGFRSHWATPKSPKSDHDISCWKPWWLGDAFWEPLIQGISLSLSIYIYTYTYVYEEISRPWRFHRLLQDRLQYHMSIWRDNQLTYGDLLVVYIVTLCKVL